MRNTVITTVSTCNICNTDTVQLSVTECCIKPAVCVVQWSVCCTVVSCWLYWDIPLRNRSSVFPNTDPRASPRYV